VGSLVALSQVATAVGFAHAAALTRAPRPAFRPHRAPSSGSSRRGRA
jgi:hypothetical protein